jgi:hypothetical protein
MKSLTRHDLLKTSLLAPAVVSAAQEAVATGKVALNATPEAPAGSRPAIGPPPDGSDPSMGTGFGRPSPLLVLHWVDR